MNLNYTYNGKYEEPKYESELAAGFDLRNNFDSDVVIKPNESVIIPTGVSVSIPHGMVGLLFARSSLGFKFDTTLANSVGVIDADFRGEIKAKIFNHSKEDVIIKAGDRFCQLVITHSPQFELNKVDNLDTTQRGENGFGSTGTK